MCILDANKIRIRMNEATGEIKEVIVDGTTELVPGKNRTVAAQFRVHEADSTMYCPGDGIICA